MPSFRTSCGQAAPFTFEVSKNGLGDAGASMLDAMFCKRPRYYILSLMHNLGFFLLSVLLEATIKMVFLHEARNQFGLFYADTK